MKGLWIVCGIAITFLCWGLLIFFTVGYKWPPQWNFGSVPDVPGLSIHSTSGPALGRPTTPIAKGAMLPYRQHVMGRDQDEKGVAKEEP